MHVEKHLIGELEEVDRGGYSTVFWTQYKNRSVAVKIIRVSEKDFDRYHSVST